VSICGRYLSAEFGQVLQHGSEFFFLFVELVAQALDDGGGSLGDEGFVAQLVAVAEDEFFEFGFALGELGGFGGFVDDAADEDLQLWQDAGSGVFGFLGGGGVFGDGGEAERFDDGAGFFNECLGGGISWLKDDGLPLAAG